MFKKFKKFKKFKRFKRLVNLLNSLNTLNLLNPCNSTARALGFEPRSKVLETRMLPLHHARKKGLMSLASQTAPKPWYFKELSK